jgi:hypothetical protein
MLWISANAALAYVACALIEEDNIKGIIIMIIVGITVFILVVRCLFSFFYYIYFILCMKRRMNSTRDDIKSLN